MRNSLVWRNSESGWQLDIYKNGQYKASRKPHFWDGRPEFIRMYTEGPCPQIQKYLRAGIDEYDPSKNFGLDIQTVIDGIDRELENRASSPKTSIVWRMDDGELISHQANKTIVDRGYTSTTVDTGIFSGKRSVLYRIEGVTPDAGAMVDSTSQYDEAEYMLRRGSRFEVVSDNRCYFKQCRKHVRLVVLRYIGREA